MTDTTQPTPGTRISAQIEDLFHAQRGQEFIINSLLRFISTAKLVQVDSVTLESDYAGFVHVKRLVLDVDTNGIRIDESVTYGLPFNRLQGGQSAFICDPAPGDIGLAVFADRASQAAIATRAEALPDNDRILSEMDGFYFGGFLNGTPAQYVKMLSDTSGKPQGITIYTPENLTLQAGGTISITSGGTTTISASALIVNAPTTFNDTISGTKSGAGNYSFPNLSVNGKSVEGHVHGGVETGTSDTAAF